MQKLDSFLEVVLEILGIIFFIVILPIPMIGTFMLMYVLYEKDFSDKIFKPFFNLQDKYPSIAMCLIILQITISIGLTILVKKWF